MLPYPKKHLFSATNEKKKLTRFKVFSTYSKSEIPPHSQKEVQSTTDQLYWLSNIMVKLSQSPCLHQLLYQLIIENYAEQMRSSSVKSSNKLNAYFVTENVTTKQYANHTQSVKENQPKESSVQNVANKILQSASAEQFQNFRLYIAQFTGRNTNVTAMQQCLENELSKL